MWENFRAAFLATKKHAGTRASALDGLIRLLDAYPAEGSPEALRAIQAEIDRISRQSRLFSQNPAEKYRAALTALRGEITSEQSRLRTHASNQTPAARAEVAMRLQRTAPLVTDPTASANVARRSEHWAHWLRNTPTEAEYCARISAAFAKIIADPKFARYLHEQVGWTSCKAWISWALRAATPAMLTREVATDLRNGISALALRAAMARKVYLERYLLELALYCATVEDRADISFFMSQASLVFGPIVAPLLAVPLSGAAGTAASIGVGAARGVGEQALRLGVRTAARPLPTTRQGELAAPAPDVDLMRYTQAWLNYVIAEPGDTNELREAITTIKSEFGGAQGCRVLLAELSPL